MYTVYNNITRQFEPLHIAEYLYKGGTIRHFVSPELFIEMKITEEREIDGVLCGIVNKVGAAIYDGNQEVKEAEIVSVEEIEAEEPSVEELEGAREQNREQEETPPWED